MLRLYEAWLDEREKVTGARPTQEVIAEQLGVGQSALSQRLKGKLALGKKFAASIATLIGCSVADFSPDLAAEIDGLAATASKHLADEFALVRRADVKFSAGHGHIVYHEGHRSALSFRREFLREIGVHEGNAVIVTVKGHSMEPTIKDGAALLVSLAAQHIIDREVYAFRLGDELYVKRLRKHNDALIAESDNPDKDLYPDIRINGEKDFEMIGRGLWQGARL